MTFFSRRIGSRWHELLRNCLICWGLVMGLGLRELARIEAQGIGTEPKLKYEEPRSLDASIYQRAADRQRLLFRFKRRAERSGSNLKVVRDYTYPDGKLAV